MFEDFEEIEIESEDHKVKVCLSWLGEGVSGDYIADDPEDEPLLRMDIYRKFEGLHNLPENAEYFCEADSYEDGDWMYVHNSSYCTQLDARSPREQLIDAAKFILGQVEDDVKNYTRRNYDHLSWIELVDGQPNVTLLH
jgi:hypothetical protein